MWVIYALLSAIFASLTSILAKLALNVVDSSLATAIRTTVVLVMAWGIVFATGVEEGLKGLSSRNIVFLILSGLATGCSWIFYYKAIQLGEVSKVVSIDKMSTILTLVFAFIILGESFTIKTLIGGLLITLGTLAIVL